MDEPYAQRRLKKVAQLALATVILLIGLPVRSASAAHPNALWHVVHDLCVRDRRLTGLSAPCLKVNLRGGYAVVPDLRSYAQLLVVPIRRVTGIEDPQLLEPGSPNYWQDAWDARALLSRRIGDDIPRETVAMAINAIPGRSQEQLHIHLSCIRPDVADGLRSAASSLGDSWSSVMIRGEIWRARTLAGEDFGGADPFKLLADSDPLTAETMGQQTLVVVGAQLSDHAPGFYLLARAADPVTGYSGHGEFLLDKACGSVRSRAP